MLAPAILAGAFPVSGVVPVRVLTFLIASTAIVHAQQGPKAGPEYDILKKHVGTWTTTMNIGGTESKGTATFSMELGGLWLSGTMEAELFGQKFSGKGMDSYDATKKKYVSIWVDSMSTSPVLMEGTYDADKKTLSMEGTGPGEDGKPQKYKSTSTFKDDDTFVMTMSMGDSKDSTFTVTYKRKK
jgi:hypothetical protein